MTDRAFGIDVSRWQQTVDWAAVKGAGASFAFIKASQHLNYTDPNFKANWAGAKAAGLPRGAYHFFQPGINPQKQAEYFAQVLGEDAGELPPVLDLEDPGQMGNKQLVEHSKIFLDTLQQMLQRKPLIYTSRIFWNDRMWWPAGQYAPYTKDYEFWVAHYTTQPEPKTHASWPGWRIWQYTETGKIAGVAGKVDLNWFNGTVAEFNTWMETQANVSFATLEVADYSALPDESWAQAVSDAAPPARGSFAGDA